MITDRLIFYKMDNGSLIKRFGELLLGEEKAEALSANGFGRLVSDISENTIFTCINEFIEFGVNHGYKGNLWHLYMTNFLVHHENSFSKSAEMIGKPKGSLCSLALNDMSIFKKLFTVDLKIIEKRYSFKMDCISDFEPPFDGGKVFQEELKDEIEELCAQLEKADTTESFLDTLSSFYKKYGVGDIGLHKAFRVDDNGNIYPVARVGHVKLSDLLGYEEQKKQLIDNTESFINNKASNNCLLYGDSGTGKSTSIKAITNQYYKKGLRTIEIYKHQFKHINDIIQQIKNRNYKFILYMDDLSFESFETEYKYLKAVIEGGLEHKPKNILIYATSNRRHLIRETFSDKADRDELHKNDTVQEKLSLYSRFGVTIYYGAPNKKNFNKIVSGLSKRSGLDISEEELLEKANMWELSHGGLSGRTAQQFIDYLVGTKPN